MPPRLKIAFKHILDQFWVTPRQYPYKTLICYMKSDNNQNTSIKSKAAPAARPGRPVPAAPSRPQICFVSDQI